jgi:RimJ/RimL family protein N-acetyltransferase
MTIKILRKTLKGNRITIKHIEPTFKNAKMVFDSINQNREHLEYWFSWALPKNTATPEDCLNFLSLAQKQRNELKLFDYGIYLKDKLIGKISIYTNKNDNSSKIGYWLDKDFTKNGYITEAVKTIEKEAFENAQINRIEICCDAENEKSANIAKRLGYFYEGTAREKKLNLKNGRYRNILTFSKLKSEYKKQLNT